MSYESLQADEIIATVGRLKQRINDRFPDSGLSRVCAHLLEFSRQATIGLYRLDDHRRIAGDRDARK